MINFWPFWPKFLKITPQAKGIAFAAKVLEKIIFLTSKLKSKKSKASSFASYKISDFVRGKARGPEIFWNDRYKVIFRNENHFWFSEKLKIAC